MKMLIIFTVVIILIAVYVLFGRAWLKRQGWAVGIFASIEPIEIALWSKSETILWARLKVLTGIILTILTQAQVIDITPLLPFIPDQYDSLATHAWAMLPMLISLMGLADEKLRRDTTKPLSVVTLPDILPPKVADALANAEAAKVEAVEIAKVAVADGTIAAEQTKI